MSEKLPSKINARIELLQRFRDHASRWYKGDYNEESSERLRSNINQDLVAVRQAVIDAGAMRLVTIGPPPAIGGIVPQNVDPFRNFFNDFWGYSMVQDVLDCVEQSVGVYHYMLKMPGLSIKNQGNNRYRNGLRTLTQTCFS